MVLRFHLPDYLSSPMQVGVPFPSFQYCLLPQFAARASVHEALQVCFGFAATSSSVVARSMCASPGGGLYREVGPAADSSESWRFDWNLNS